MRLLACALFLTGLSIAAHGASGLKRELCHPSLAEAEGGLVHFAAVRRKQTDDASITRSATVEVVDNEKPILRAELKPLFDPDGNTIYWVQVSKSLALSTKIEIREDPKGQESDAEAGKVLEYHIRDFDSVKLQKVLDELSHTTN